MKNKEEFGLIKKIGIFAIIGIGLLICVSGCGVVKDSTEDKVYDPPAAAPPLIFVLDSNIVTASVMQAAANTAEYYEMTAEAIQEFVPSILSVVMLESGIFGAAQMIPPVTSNATSTWTIPGLYIPSGNAIFPATANLTGTTVADNSVQWAISLTMAGETSVLTSGYTDANLTSGVNWVFPDFPGTVAQWEIEDPMTYDMSLTCQASISYMNFTTTLDCNPATTSSFVFKYKDTRTDETLVDYSW